MLCSDNKELENAAVGSTTMSWGFESGFSYDWKKHEFTLFQNYCSRKVSCWSRRNGKALRHQEETVSTEKLGSVAY